MNALTPHALLQQAPGAPLDADPEETAEWRDAFLALVATEGGLVEADDVPEAVAEAGSLDTGFDVAAAQRLSQATREKFLEIARSLEEAQATLGRQLGRNAGRSDGGKFS